VNKNRSFSTHQTTRTEKKINITCSPKYWWVWQFQYICLWFTEDYSSWTDMSKASNIYWQDSIVICYSYKNNWVIKSRRKKRTSVLLRTSRMSRTSRTSRTSDVQKCACSLLDQKNIIVLSCMMNKNLLTSSTSWIGTHVTVLISYRILEKNNFFIL